MVRDNILTVNKIWGNKKVLNKTCCPMNTIPTNMRMLVNDFLEKHHIAMFLSEIENQVTKQIILRFTGR